MLQYVLATSKAMSARGIIDHTSLTTDLLVCMYEDQSPHDTVASLCCSWQLASVEHVMS